MEPMRVLPVYSHWPILLNRFSLFSVLEYRSLKRESQTQTNQDKNEKDETKRREYDGDEEGKKSIEQDQGGNFIMKARRKGGTEGIEPVAVAKKNAFPIYILIRTRGIAPSPSYR